MNKYLVLSALATGLLVSINANAAEDSGSMLSEGKVGGQIRMFHVDREYQGSSGADTHRDATAIGGYIKYQTADYKGLSLGAAFYTTNAMFMHTQRDDYSQNDMTLLGKNNESYSMLGEAYIDYKNGNTSFKGGRQKLSTPMMGADDARMLPNLFEAYVLTNKDIANTTLTLGHVTKFAQGTFGRVYDGGLLSATAGYSADDSRDKVGKFVDMGGYAYGTNTDGVTMASITYTGIENLKVQLWDYYAHDIVNTIYGDVDYKMGAGDVKPFIAAQFIKQNDVGDSSIKNSSLAGNGKVDSFYLAAKVGAKYNNLTAYIAYSQTTNNDSAETYQNAIISTWGGMPAYTQGMVTRHQFMAGTDATKIVASYNLKDLGVKGSATAYYTSFKMDENSGYGIARTATEPGFDIQYYPEAVKNLQLRLRGNFPRKFADSGAGDTGWNEYRFIVNYNF